MGHARDVQGVGRRVGAMRMLAVAAALATAGALLPAVGASALTGGPSTSAETAVRTATSPAPPGRHENSSAAIAYAGSGWATLASSASSGGSVRYSTVAGASATIVFSGNQVLWESWRSPNAGVSTVTLDGVVVATVDRYSTTSDHAFTAFDSGPLTDGTHTLKITATSKRAGGNTLIDAFVVLRESLPAGPASIDRAADCPAATRSVSTASGLQSALDAAGPGTVIKLAAGTYRGQFRLQRDGTTAQPIRVCGPRTAVLTAGMSTGARALVLDGATHVVATGFTVADSFQGVAVKWGGDVTISDLSVRDIGYEAIHLYAFTTDSIVAFNRVESTGVADVAYGEGVYIGTSQRRWDEVTAGAVDASDRNVVVHNTILDAGAEPIEAKEGTSDGIIAYNTISGHRPGSRALGWVLVTGNDWTVHGNTGTEAVTNGYASATWNGEWGFGNMWSSNRGDANASGYGVWIQPIGLRAPAGTYARCSNAVTDAASGAGTFACLK